MAAAIRLSRRHDGLTGDNPSVGCIIVRDGIAVGRGVTGRVPARSAPLPPGSPIAGGRPHAERAALDDAGERARGATAYVTLEPCAHHGRTPPCADALVEAGVARVVVGACDSDGRVSGRGIARLREAGIVVREGVLEQECRGQLAGFLSRTERGRPHVILKLAVSSDGYLGRSDRGNVAVTGPIAHARAHVIRARCQAVIVGARTAILDRPQLNVRLPGVERDTIGVVLDRGGAFETDLERWGEQSPHLIVREPDLSELMAFGMARGWSTIMVEGGAAVARSFLDADLVDEIALFVGARSLGGDVASPLAPNQVPDGFALEREERLGDDRLWTMRRA